MVEITINIENTTKNWLEQEELPGDSVEEKAARILDNTARSSHQEKKTMTREQFIKYAGDMKEKIGPQKSDSVDLIREIRDR